MPTNWSLIAGASMSAHTTGGNAHGTIIPQAGDLCVVGVEGDTTAIVPSAFSLSDTGSGGWNVLTSIVTQPTQDFGGTSGAASFWKIATALDNNGGLGVTLTATMTAANPNGTTVECDVFRLAGGTVLGVDLAASVVGNSDVTTVSLSPGSGSAQPSNTDELAWTSLSAVAPQPITGTNTFTGTSAAANLAPGVFTPATSRVITQFVGGVQASATAGTDVWVNTWTNSRKPILLAATFYGTQINEQIVMVV